MPRDAPRLYLVTPPVDDWAACLPHLNAAIAARDGTCDLACVLLRMATDTEGAVEAAAREFVPLLQNHGIACLLQDPELALKVNADGIHVEGAGPELQSAMRALKPDKIVGAGGLWTRDAAMTAGEVGADYVMFGEPEGDESPEDIAGRVAWWAEIFNVPCVGYARDIAAISDLVRAGADFIAMGEAIFDDPRGAGPALREASSVISQTLETIP